MNVNWKVRVRNWVFWAQVALAVITPILAYMGLTAQDITSWGILGSVLFEAIKNPYVLFMVCISVFNAINDPTTKGFSDSKQALSYDSPKKKGE